MNIKDFLIDNYIWIIVIILITIITIIGFLADRKKDNKEKTPQEPVPRPDLEEHSSTQMHYQPQESSNNMQNQMNNEIKFPNENVNIQNNQDLTNKTLMNGEMPTANTVPTPTDINPMNNSKTNENITPNAIHEPMYQPLSEQKPNIPPQVVPNYSNILNNNPEMNKAGNGINQNNLNAMNMGNNYQNTQQTMMPNQNFNNQNIVSNNNNNNNFNRPPMEQMNNYNQQNTTIPTSVDQIRRPQPISPQPIMQNTYNNMHQMPNQSFNTGMSQGINSQPMNQQQGQQSMPNQMTTPQPINFVFGPQNNNQNM